MVSKITFYVDSRGEKVDNSATIEKVVVRVPPPAEEEHNPTHDHHEGDEQQQLRHHHDVEQENYHNHHSHPHQAIAAMTAGARKQQQFDYYYYEESNNNSASNNEDDCCAAGAGAGPLVTNSSLCSSASSLQLSPRQPNSTTTPEAIPEQAISSSLPLEEEKMNSSTTINDSSSGCIDEEVQQEQRGQQYNNPSMMMYYPPQHQPPWPPYYYHGPYSALLSNTHYGNHGGYYFYLHHTQGGENDNNVFHGDDKKDTKDPQANTAAASLLMLSSRKEEQEEQEGKNNDPKEKELVGRKRRFSPKGKDGIYDRPNIRCNSSSCGGVCAKCKCYSPQHIQNILDIYKSTRQKEITAHYKELEDSETWPKETPSFFEQHDAPFAPFIDLLPGYRQMPYATLEAMLELGSPIGLVYPLPTKLKRHSVDHLMKKMPNFQQTSSSKYKWATVEAKRSERLHKHKKLVELGNDDDEDHDHYDDEEEKIRSDSRTGITKSSKKNDITAAEENNGLIGSKRKLQRGDEHDETGDKNNNNNNTKGDSNDSPNKRFRRSPNSYKRHKFSNRNREPNNRNDLASAQKQSCCSLNTNSCATEQGRCKNCLKRYIFGGVLVDAKSNASNTHMNNFLRAAKNKKNDEDMIKSSYFQEMPEGYAMMKEEHINAILDNGRDFGVTFPIPSKLNSEVVQKIIDSYGNNRKKQGRKKKVKL